MTELCAGSREGVQKKANAFIVAEINRNAWKSLHLVSVLNGSLKNSYNVKDLRLDTKSKGLHL